MGILQEFLFVPWLKLLWVVCATGCWHHRHHLRSLNSSPSCPGWAAICKQQHAFLKFQSILIQILAKLAVLFVVSFFHIWISCNRNWDWDHKSRILWHFHHCPFVFLGCNEGRVIDTNIVLEISKNLSRNFVKNLLRDFVNKFVSTLRPTCWLLVKMLFVSVGISDEKKPCSCPSSLCDCCRNSVSRYDDLWCSLLLLHHYSHDPPLKLLKKKLWKKRQGRRRAATVVFCKRSLEMQIPAKNQPQ